jgi:hypothetical protein
VFVKEREGGKERKRWGRKREREIYGTLSCKLSSLKASYVVIQFKGRSIGIE